MDFRSRLLATLRRVAPLFEDPGVMVGGPGAPGGGADDDSVKFWLEPVALARNLGFSAQELRDIERLIRGRRALLLEAWYGYHGDAS